MFISSRFGTFDDIKYFFKKSVNSVVCKNLFDWKNQYEAEDSEKKNFQFLKQYLTLNKAELFFAEKIVFIEGDTERILLQAMMKKIDDENKDENDTPLLSQNISIVEVGAYSHIFDTFLNFLGIKTLIITDIDSVGSNSKKCSVADGENTSNASIKHFLKDKEFNELKTLNHASKILFEFAFEFHQLFREPYQPLFNIVWHLPLFIIFTAVIENIRCKKRFFVNTVISNIIKV
jgi:predicted ATP-dependent endonuclease of OLD family